VSKNVKVELRVNTKGLKAGSVVEVDKATAERLEANGHAALVPEPEKDQAAKKKA
jgi:hypothetical protein